MGLLITLSLLISPELMAAVTNSNQEKIMHELVDQYNHEVHTFGDFQEFAKKHSEQGLNNLNVNISKIDKTMKAPKLEYKNGKIQTEVLGKKLEFEMTSNNIKLSYGGKQFDLGVAKKLKFNEMRPVLNHMIVSTLNRNRDLKSSLAMLETIDPIKAKKVRDYYSSHKSSKLLSFPKLQATDEYIVYKDTYEKEIFIKLLSESEIEMKAYGKVFKFDSKLSPSDIEVILKKELTNVASDQKVTLDKVINLFVGTAHAGVGEDASKIYDKYSNLTTLMAMVVIGLFLAPTLFAALVMATIWLFLVDPAIAGTLHYAKKKDILEMISKCANANGPDENTKVASTGPRQNLEDVTGVSLEEALAKFDKFEEICSNDSKCSINNDLAKCKLKTIKLYKSVDTSPRSQQKERTRADVRQDKYDSSTMGNSR